MSVAAVYRNGVFVPTEKVDLPEESPVTVLVPVVRERDTRSAWERHAFGRKVYMSPDFDASLPDFKDPLPEMEDPPDCCFDEDPKT